MARRRRVSLRTAVIVNSLNNTDESREFHSRKCSEWKERCERGDSNACRAYKTYRMKGVPPCSKIAGRLHTPTRPAPEKRGYTEKDVEKGLYWGLNAGPGSPKPPAPKKKRRKRKAAAPPKKRGGLLGLFG